MLRRISFLTVLLSVLLMSASSLMAQRGAGAGGGAGGAGAGGPGGGRGRGGGGTQGQLDLIKVQLGASDDEWRVLSPKVEKLLAVWSDVYRIGETGVTRGGAAGGGRGGRGGAGGAGGAAGGRGGPGGNVNSDVQRALTELQTTLDNTASTPEQISLKLAQYRETKAKAVTTLAALRKELKELLTSRQEALMVTYGYLE